ncbi:MAG: hypothetical protein J4N97_11465 [Chloroflexi bacterium]|nr:hypothetical protein [Chloroflexota bacterium]
MDPDTFLTTVYVIVVDLCQAKSGEVRPKRRGRKPVLSESEVITLALLSRWHGRGSERAFLRFAERHWSHSYGARIITPRNASQHFASPRELNRRRQIVETVFGILCDTFRLKFPRARTIEGLEARIACKVAVIGRVEEALRYVPADRMTLNPDCGFSPGAQNPMDVDEAYLKLSAMSAAADELRRRHG